MKKCPKTFYNENTFFDIKKVTKDFRNNINFKTTFFLMKKLKGLKPGTEKTSSRLHVRTLKYPFT